MEFETPGLKDRVTHAVSVLKTFGCGLALVDGESDYFEWVSETGEESEGALCENWHVGPASKLLILLPKVEDSSPELSIEAFCELMEEAEGARLEANRRYKSQKRILILVGAGDETDLYFHGLGENWLGDREFCQHFNVAGIEGKVGLVFGFSPFALLVTKNGDYDDFWPPYFANEPFVEITSGQELVDKDVDAIFHGYCFELESSLGLAVQETHRATHEEWSVIGDSLGRVSDLRCNRLRPILSGPGLPEVLEIYNKAASIDDDELAVLVFVLAVEYVSQTVIRLRANEQIRAKLLQPEALDPDASYIEDLAGLIEGHRDFRSDAVALKITIEKCCDPVRLAPLAPPVLGKLRCIEGRSKAQEKAQALEELAGCLSATRNQIAHAKSNYRATGMECPSGQMSRLRECARVVAMETIRWFAETPVKARVIG